VRNTGFQQSVAEVQKLNFTNFTLNNGDVIYVDSILSRFENRIEIEGAVFRPGFFSLDNNESLAKLIKSAGGTMEEAFVSRATILRRKSDNSQEMIAIELSKVLDGTLDLPLQREDKITIASNFEMKESQTITISGNVKYPGIYPFASNMRVEDVIIMAGGLLESASTENIQIAQRVEDANRLNKDAILSQVITLQINKTLKEKSGENYFLKPYDAVTVFPKPGYVAQKHVEIRGEVMFPGAYSILRSDDRVSDLIQRAGGITALGYAGGAILIRKRTNNYQDILIKENKLLALKRVSRDSLKVAILITEEMGKTTDAVGIDLARIMKKPGSKEDVVLSENDILEIPSINQTVFISGEVLYPVRISFEPNKKFRSYVSNAGGFSSKALKRRSYIVYPNGTAKDTKSFLGFKNYPKVLPGSELVIPTKEEKKTLSPLEIVTITTSLTSMLVLISTLLK
jgi:protein involved in polysaccharide export with SLBB domain